MISDGALSFPVSFALPSTSRPDAESLLTANALPTDAFQAQVNVAVIKSGAELILIDTGSGLDFMPGVGRFADALEAAGINPDSITKVIFTHAHADHLWGVIDPLDGGSRFAKAQHIMTAAEFDFWMKPDIETRVASPFRSMAIGTQRRLKAIAERLDKREPGAEIVPGISLVDTAGHTPGHVSVMLRSGSEQLLIGGDVLTQHAVSFQQPDWKWGADMEPDRAIATRRRILDQLATGKTALLGYHLPWPGLGHVERKDAAYRFIAV